MQGLMMNFPLTLEMILRRAETLHARREVVSRISETEWHRYTYADLAPRCRQLALALRRLGVARGDRVGTLCWNHYRHLEAYLGVPLGGAVLHTLNPRLSADDLSYIINEADDRVLIVDESLLPVYEQVQDQISVPQVVVVSESRLVPAGMLHYDALIEGEDDAAFSSDVADENQAAMMCYTSGTVGRPKGVLYSHRALVLHTLIGAMAGSFEIREEDHVLPAVPMFHVNAWGIPYLTTMVGAQLVLSNRWLDPVSLLTAFQRERITFSAGVPTIWIEILKFLDAEPERFDVSCLRRAIVGGAALPTSLMQAYRDRYEVQLLHAWGMTETTPIGTFGRLRSGQRDLPADQRDRLCGRQGTPVPLVEIRARGAEGLVPWDGKSMGELEVRGPFVAGAYFDRPDAADRFSDDGWFRTGDVVSIDELGSMKIEDREKDLIKSGGEWISSVDLENTLMAHPAVFEAAVIGVPHEKWGERPLAAVVLESNQTASADELLEFLRPSVASWWLPERIEFVEAIPKTAVGKFKKSVLREQFS
ncbi:MAG: long-chain fatty acid--CoA ligase [Planctomycetota bacterium]